MLLGSLSRDCSKIILQRTFCFKYTRIKLMSFPQQVLVVNLYFMQFSQTNLLCILWWILVLTYTATLHNLGMKLQLKSWDHYDYTTLAYTNKKQQTWLLAVMSLRDPEVEFVIRYLHAPSIMFKSDAFGEL